MHTITFDRDIAAGSQTFEAGQELDLDPENPWQSSEDNDAPLITLNTKSESYTVPLWAISQEDRLRLGMGFAIPAEIHSDDYAEEADFDALAWFDRASDDKLVDLAHSGYGGDYPADELARWMQEYLSSRDPMTDIDSWHMGSGIVRVFDHQGGSGGFEVSIDAESAYAWIKLERPHLLAQIDVN